MVWWNVRHQYIPHWNLGSGKCVYTLCLSTPHKLPFSALSRQKVEWMNLVNERQPRKNEARKVSSLLQNIKVSTHDVVNRINMAFQGTQRERTEIYNAPLTPISK